MRARLAPVQQAVAAAAAERRDAARPPGRTGRRRRALATFTVLASRLGLLPLYEKSRPRPAFTILSKPSPTFTLPSPYDSDSGALGLRYFAY